MVLVHITERVLVYIIYIFFVLFISLKWFLLIIIFLFCLYLISHGRAAFVFHGKHVSQFVTLALDFTCISVSIIEMMSLILFFILIVKSDTTNNSYTTSTTHPKDVGVSMNSTSLNSYDYIYKYTT